jgi:two-component sensor histidine kinase
LVDDISAIDSADPGQGDCRLAALLGYDILDTPPEQGFDDVVHIAAHVCAAPIALVSLVETNRQWFKARVGLEANETPINQSVCALGLGSTELLIIPDLTIDPRTISNTLVTGEAALRFYAGAPLIAPGGEVLGMLCVIDVVPRPEGLTEAQQSVLAALARQVIAQFDLRQAIAKKVKAEADQQLLNEELSHRLKNTLAMVQGIANQTLRDIDDRVAVEAFDDRLMALSIAHDILLQGSWASADIRAIVAGGIAVQGCLHQCEIAGPDLLVGPRAALSMAMLVHELTTNAIKYGALSDRAGVVTIDWRVEGDGEEEHFVMHWTERGGPAVATPQRRGFGSKLIGMGIAGSRDVEERFDPSGLSARFKARLSRMKES